MLSDFWSILSALWLQRAVKCKRLGSTSINIADNIMKWEAFLFPLRVFYAGLKPTKGEEHQGVRGGVVHILCSHSNAHSNVKYFCREPCKDSDVLVTSQEIKPKGRYNIKDEGNTFLVTISDLEINDSGSYRCGIKRIGWDTYQKVVLTVIEGELLQQQLWPTAAHLLNGRLTNLICSFLKKKKISRHKRQWNNINHSSCF